MDYPSLLDRHIRSIADSSIGLPGFPPEQIQVEYVGSSGESSLQDCWPFVQRVLQVIPLDQNSTVVDFGVGWGRIARFFHETPANVFLADISNQALCLVKEYGIRGIPLKVEESRSIPLSSSSVDLVYSYSVFSHISEGSAIFWINEMHRILKSGGAFVFTALSLRFLDFVRRCSIIQNPTALERSIGAYIESPELAIENFCAGKHVFTGVGGREMQGLSADNYGWAAMPRTWLESIVDYKFKIEEYEDRSVNPIVQDIIVLRKV